MTLPGDLLRRDVEDVVRLIALDLVSQAREAAPRSLDPDDEEGLHDLRVAIRRLRSTFSAWKGLLRGVVRKSDRRALAGLQKSTGSSRDAEVALLWLEDQHAELCPEHLPGLKWLAGQLRCALGTRASCRHPPDRSAGPAGGHLLLTAEFLQWAGEFEERVGFGRPYRNGVAVRGETTYAEALAGRVERAADQLRARVAAVDDNDRDRALHRTRIACKRLRYLVEPVHGSLEAARSVVERCTQVQDVLGDLNDVCVMGDMLRSALAGPEAACAHGAAPAPEAPRLGLEELLQRNTLRRARLSERFDQDWLAGGMKELLEEAAGLAGQLREVS